MADNEWDFSKPVNGVSREKPAFYKRKGFFTVMTVVGALLLLLGGTLCCVAGITLRPDPIDYEDYDYDEWDELNEDQEERDEKIKAKDQMSAFIYMIGTTFMELGILIFVILVLFAALNDTYPVGVRITAGIMLMFLIPFFFWVFVISGPLRLTTLIGTGGVI